MTFKFSENETVEDIELVDENLRGFYSQQKEGGWVIQESLRPAAAAWDGINNANQNIRKENKTLKSAKVDLSPLADYGNTPEDILSSFQSQKQELSDALDKKKDAVNPDKIRNEMNKAFDEKTKLLTARNEALEAQLYNTLVTSEALSAISAEKGDANLLMPFVTKQVKMQDMDGKLVARVMDEDGEIKIGGTGQPMTVGELVKSMKKDKMYSKLFEADQKPGSGAPPNRQPTGGPLPGQAKVPAATRIQNALQNRR